MKLPDDQSSSDHDSSDTETLGSETSEGNSVSDASNHGPKGIAEINEELYGNFSTGGANVTLPVILLPGSVHLPLHHRSRLSLPMYLYSITLLLWSQLFAMLIFTLNAWQDFSMRRARILELSALTIVDLSFFDLNIFNSSLIHARALSQESLINAKTMIMNYAELGLLHLNDSEKDVMMSAASMLLVDPSTSQSEFGSLLEQLPAILSSSDTAASASLDTLNSLNTFKLEKQKKYALDHE